MKKLMTMMAAAVAMMVTSCLEHHAVIQLNKDGSGTLTEETTFGAQAIAMMDQMAALGGEEAEDPLADLVDKDKAEAKLKELGEGVTLEKVEAIDEGGRKGARVVYAFKDINKLNFSFGNAMAEMGEGMKPPGGEEPAEENTPLAFVYKDGVLTLKNPDAGKVAEGGADEDAADEEIDAEGLAMAKQMMGDMKMSMKIEFPGGIEESNASFVDGNTVTFMEMDMGKLLDDPEKFKALSKAKPDSPAEMQKALQGIDGVKVETKEEITIKLK